MLPPVCRNVERLGVRLIAHPALYVYDYPVVAALIAAVTLIAAACYVPELARMPSRGIALALAVGLIAVTTARLLADRFDAAASAYNSWMRPAFCVVLASGLAARVRSLRVAAAVAAAVLVVAQASGDYQLATHGDYFAHGPHRRVATLIRELGVDRVAVVHDDGSPRVDLFYRPLRYEFGRASSTELLLPPPKPHGHPRRQFRTTIRRAPLRPRWSFRTAISWSSVLSGPAYRNRPSSSERE